jgi:NADPH2:quinone reductase
MKSIVVNEFGGPEVLAMQEMPEPTLLPGHVLVEVELASVNFADVMARQGRYHGGSTPPFVPGLDVVGIVKEVADPEDHHLIGTRVFGFPAGGSYQELALCDRRLIGVAPDNASVVDLGAAPLVLCTALELVRLAESRGTIDSAIVYAASGGVGGTLVQLLRQRGVNQIIALVGTEEKAKRAHEFGTTTSIVYRGRADYGDAIMDATNGMGVDVSFNSVAGKTADTDLRVVKNFGAIMVFGMASGEPGVYHSSELHGSARSVMGFSFGTMRRTRTDAVPELLSRAREVIASGALRFPVEQIVAPSDVSTLHERMEAGETSGKLLIDFT